MEPHPTFGQWVKLRRRRLDFTRESLAICVGCSLATIEKVETGERRPSRQIAELLARCLQVPSGEVSALVSFARGETVHMPPALQALIDHPTGLTPLSNLPAPPTAFIGREREVEEVSALLRQAEVRLLTLTGPPGIGKTRLSLRVASRMGAEFGDGVFFVPLAPINDESLVAPAIAQSLGVRETSSQPSLEALKSRLRDKRLLLVLDNFEQVVPAGRIVGELLSAAPGLKVLATSRTLLRVYGEHTFSVPPMSLPDHAHLPQFESLTGYEAIDLFMQRARAVYPGFTLTSDNAQVVAQICHKLDGLPLAIELAAHRMKVLSPQKVLAHLEERLDLLVEGADNLPARQRTLRGAIDWSYDLLDPGEQALFRRLSVFAGGCTLEAAEVVCNFELSADTNQPQNSKLVEILTALASLVDKSLLRREDIAEEPWFSMLETIREYAWEKLSLDEGEMQEAIRHHAEYYLRLAEETEPLLSGEQQGSWLARLEREHDNFRAALRRSHERGDITMLARLGATLRRFWYLHAHMSEGRQWLQKALAAEGRDLLPRDLQAKVLHGIGTLAWAQGDNTAAGRFFQESLAIWRELGDKRGVANMLNNLGIVALPQGDYDTAHEMHTESLALYRELDDKWSIALALANLGLVALNKGQYEQAQSLLTSSLNLRREFGDRQGIAQSLNNLGIVMRSMGKQSESQSLHAESLDMFQELGDRWSVALTLANLGFVALREDVQKARSLFNESLALSIELDLKAGIANCLEGLAEVAVETERADLAATLFGAAEELRNVLGIPLPRDRRESYAVAKDAARAKLGEAAFAEAWETGRAMPIEQACAYAMRIGSF
jgi:predicted ATPase/DNA-binding XRE family transcriptional regulator